MKLYELVNTYHIGTDLTCAEALLKACDEYYELHLSEDSKKMFSVMGIGMQSELSCCGAFSVAVGIIGLFTAQEDGKDYENRLGYDLICELTEYFIENFYTLQCLDLQKLTLQNTQNPCHRIVESIAIKLEELLSSEKKKAMLS